VFITMSVGWCSLMPVLGGLDCMSRHAQGVNQLVSMRIVSEAVDSWKPNAWGMYTVTMRCRIRGYARRATGAV
jgi:hypothetical protein